MRKEKQIEEMARQNCHIEYHMKNYKTCKECYETNYCACRVYEVCRNLYNAGYRKQSEGEWVEKNIFFAIYKCSICGAENLYKDGHACLSKFCPNCGAKMKGGE